MDTNIVEAVIQRMLAHAGAAKRSYEFIQGVRMQVEATYKHVQVFNGYAQGGAEFDAFEHGCDFVIKNWDEVTRLVNY